MSSTDNPHGPAHDEVRQAEAETHDWHLARDGQQYGPVTVVELRKLIELGHLRENDLVWRAGFADWQRLASVMSQIMVPAPQPTSRPHIPEPAHLERAVADNQPANAGRDTGGAATAEAAALAMAQRATAGQAGAGLSLAQQAGAHLANAHARAAAEAAQGAKGGAPASGHTLDARDPSQSASGNQPAAGGARDWNRNDWNAPSQQASAQPAQARGPMPGPGGGGGPASGHGAQAGQPGGYGQPQRFGPAAGHAGQPMARGDGAGTGFGPGPGSMAGPSGPQRGGAPHGAHVHNAPGAASFQRPVQSQLGPLGTQAGAAATGPRPSGDDASRGATATTRAGRRHQPELDELDEDEAPRRGGVGRVLSVMALLALIATGAGFAFMYRDTLQGMIKGGAALVGFGATKSAEQAGNAPRTIDDLAKTSAMLQKTETAAIDRPAAVAPAAPATTSDAPQPTAVVRPTPQPAEPPTAAAPAPSQAADAPLLTSPLWRELAAAFPGWERDRRADVQRFKAEGLAPDAIDARLMAAIVDLRRANAEAALASDTPHIVEVARSFLASLKAMAATSTDACFGFISGGEISPEVLTVMAKQRDIATPVHRQLSAIVRAIMAGKSTPSPVTQPLGADYTVLSDELVRRGWSRADLELFSNPQALAKAAPDQVCRLVAGWFDAQLNIADRAVQLRLLRQSLRPVVAG